MVGGEKRKRARVGGAEYGGRGFGGQTASEWREEGGAIGGVALLSAQRYLYVRGGPWMYPFLFLSPLYLK